MGDAHSDLPDHLVLQQAAEWFAALIDEQASNHERRQWRAWLNDRPENQRAWRYVEQVSQRFQQAQQQAGKEGAGRILDNTRTDRLTRRQVLGGGLASLAVCLTWSQTPLPSATDRLVSTFMADYRTSTGDIRQLALADGGRLWLNSASAVDIDYGETLRHLTLRGGEILIQTGPDPRQRPFIVTTRQGTLRALGTHFTVRQYRNHTLLAVYEGAVEIRTHDGNREVIHAGRQATFTRQLIRPGETADRARQAWSRGLILASNMLIGELVAELARYRPGHLGLDPAIGGLRVMGAYPATQPDLALTMLENALPVRINRLLPWWVTVGPK